MKKIILAFALFVGATSFYNTTTAQNISISINIGRQPAWGPVGYDYAGYYYFPDIDCYYNVDLAMFYYMNGGRWISARYLPYAYRHYDLYRIHKVVINTRNPWRYHRTHYRDYARYKGHRGQVVIRDSRDVRYRDSRKNRVAWYSSEKQRDHKKDYNYKYDNRRQDKHYSNKNNSNNDRRKDNNRYSSKDNNKNYNKYDKNKNDNRDNNRPRVDRDNKTNKTNKDRVNRGNSYNNKKQAEKSKSSNNQTRRSSSGRSSEFRLASSSSR